MDLPTELRLMIYEEIVREEAPKIDKSGDVSHTLLHPCLRRIHREVYGAIFHTVSIDLSALRNFSSWPWPNFMLLHNRHCGWNNRRRVRLEVPKMTGNWPIFESMDRASAESLILPRPAPPGPTRLQTIQQWNQQWSLRIWQWRCSDGFNAPWTLVYSDLADLSMVWNGSHSGTELASP